VRLIGCTDRGWRRPVLRVGLLAVVLALAGCNAAVDAWRNVNGISKDDPNPTTTPFVKNLAAAEARPYPNLASVPPPPSRELSTAEREKLTKSLIADRANIERSNAELRAGNAAAGGGPPPPPPPPMIPGAAPPAPAAATPATPATTALATPARRRPGRRQPGQPPQAQPPESNLESPAINGLPAPDRPQPAPPPPHLKPAAPPPNQALPGAASVATVAPPPAAPPPPPLEPAPMSPAIAKSAAKITPPPPGKPLVEIRFAAGATALGTAGRDALERLVPRWQQHPERLRIIAYAAIAGGADAQLSSFHAALERAQAVAAVLLHAGVPKDKIRVEAAPAAVGTAGDRAVVLRAP
jgi:outer membrane protein OmpA-like peptidoglycan-associated protein